MLPRRTVVAVRGDATSFLQGIVTADVVNLQEGAATSALMLTPQGRIVHEMMITSDGMGGMLLEVESDSKESLLRALNVYKLQANVEVCRVVVERPVGEAGGQGRKRAGEWRSILCAPGHC